MKELKIDEELRDLLPPLKEEEFNQLEQNIIKEGCRDAIIVWKGYIVDGHNRYEICTKHNIEFKIITLAYDTKDEIITWMIDTQLGRRNLTDIDRIDIAEKYRPVIERKAKENLKLSEGRGEKGMKISSDLFNKTETREELAKIAKVSHDTYSKGKKILESDNEEIKDKLRKGEMKINTAYKELFPKVPKPPKEISISKQSTKQSTKKCTKCGQEKENELFYIGHDICKECEQNREIKLPKEGGNVFKDTLGNPIPIKDECRIDSEEWQEMINDIKTPKNIVDFSNPTSDIECIKEICSDLVEQIEAKLFTMEKAIDKMNSDNIEELMLELDIHIEEINNVKNKINKIKDGR